jgi:hypothetical protein
MLTPRPRWGPSFCRVLCTDSKNQASWIIRITTTAVCTVPLVKLSRSILEQRVHIGKNVTEKELTKKKVSAHSIRRFDRSFFDLNFSLKSFWTGPPGEILPEIFSRKKLSDFFLYVIFSCFCSLKFFTGSGGYGMRRSASPSLSFWQTDMRGCSRPSFLLSSISVLVSSSAIFFEWMLLFLIHNNKLFQITKVNNK